jgi:paraquat-inducible protein B
MTVAPRQHHAALWVGAFVVGALVLGTIAFLWLSGNRWFEREQAATIHFQGGVAGLYVGAPVTFRGVPVGQVESIGIQVDAKSLQARIPVRVRLQPDSVQFTSDGALQQPDLRTLVQRGLRARLVAQSYVTGQKAIDLDFVPDAVPVAASPPGPVPEIPAVSDRFEALFEQLAQLPLRETLDELRGTMHSLQATLDETRGTVAATRGVIERGGARFDAVAQQGERALADARATVVALRADVQRSLASLDGFLQAGRTTIEQAQPELQATFESARAAAGAAEQAMRRVDELTDPRAPLRGDIDAAVRDLAQAARALREWSELIEDRPNALVFGRGGAAQRGDR